MIVQLILSLIVFSISAFVFLWGLIAVGNYFILKFSDSKNQKVLSLLILYAGLIGIIISTILIKEVLF